MCYAVYTLDPLALRQQRTMCDENLAALGPSRSWPWKWIPWAANTADFVSWNMNYPKPLLLLFRHPILLRLWDGTWRLVVPRTMTPMPSMVCIGEPDAPLIIYSEKYSNTCISFICRTRLAYTTREPPICCQHWVTCIGSRFERDFQSIWSSGRVCAHGKAFNILLTGQKTREKKI